MTDFGLFDGLKAPALSLNIGACVPDMADVKQITYRRGRSRPDQKYDPGTMTVVIDNASGDYDPENNADIKPGVKSTLFAAWDGSVREMFTGSLEAPVNQIGFAPEIALTFTDPSVLLQTTPLNKMADALYNTVWDGEPSSSEFLSELGVHLSDGRVQRVFDASPLIGFGSDPSHSDISGGIVPMPPIRVGKSFADIFDECALVEGGRWWIDGKGNFHFETIIDKFLRPTRLWLTDTGSEVGSIAYDAITMQTGFAYLINECVLNVVDLSGSYIQTIARHTASAANNGVKTRVVEACLTDAADAEPLACLYAQLWSDPQTAASSVSFAAHALPDYSELLQMDLGDYVVVDRKMPKPDERELTWNLTVEGIEVRMTPTEYRWTLNTSPANAISATIHAAV